MSVLFLVTILGFEALLVLSSASENVHQLDLAVLVDGSVNAGQDNFGKELQFVRKLFNRFPITKSGVHVGLAVISDSGLVAFNLKEHFSNASVNAAISKLTYPGGSSNVGQALTKVRGWVFGNSARSHVPKVLISLFKGTTGDDVKGPSAQLQADGVKIISIGVEADLVQVNTVSSIVLMENLVDFLYDNDHKINNIVTMINEASGVHSGVITDDLDEINGDRIKMDKSTIKEGKHHDSNVIGGIIENEDLLRPLDPVDIAFLIDGSEGVGKDDFERTLKFLGYFVRKFPISDAMTRVAMATISDDGRIDFGFSKKQDIKTILKSIRLVAYPAGKMNAAKAMKKVNDDIFQKYTRNSVAQVLVVIMKDKSLNDVKDVAADMRENRIKIISIATSKIHHDVDALSSLNVYKDNMEELVSDDNTQKYLYEKIKQQAVLQT